MESLLFQFPLIGWFCGIFFVLVISAFFIFKQVFTDPKKKMEDDKVLLRKLLEGFGLDIPSELQEQESNFIKSIKTH